MNEGWDWQNVMLNCVGNNYKNAISQFRSFFYILLRSVFETVAESTLGKSATNEDEMNIMIIYYLFIYYYYLFIIIVFCLWDCKLVDIQSQSLAWNSPRVRKRGRAVPIHR